MKKQLSTKGKIHDAIMWAAIAGVLFWLPAFLVCLHFKTPLYIVAEIFFWWSFCALTFETVRRSFRR